MKKITRTFTFTTYDAVYYDIDKDSKEITTVCLITDNVPSETIKAEIKNEIETDGSRLLIGFSEKQTEIVKIGMSLDDFVKHSEIISRKEEIK